MWIAYRREDGKFLQEGNGYPRPVQEGEDNKLLLIGEMAYGHSVAVNLDTGQIALDWESITLQEDGQFTLSSVRTVFDICDETNIVGNLKHLHHKYYPWFHCGKTKIISWYKCAETKTDKINGVIECENGDSQPGVCAEGHPRVEGTREVACDGGSTDYKVKFCDQGHPLFPQFRNGERVKVRSDILTPLVFRPIWFTRYTFPGSATKVIGCQTTLTKDVTGGKTKNIKCLVNLYEDGRVGISG